MKPFTDHPHSVGETYLEHMQMSFGFGARMLLASIGCFLHGLFPFLCRSTGSATVSKLHRSMVTHRNKIAAPASDARDTSQTTQRV